MNRLTVAPVGDLDTAEVDALRMSILQALGPGPAQVHFDASRVGFTGAAFLGLLAELGQALQADGGSLSVTGANAAAERIMRLCGMGHLVVAGGDEASDTIELTHHVISLDGNLQDLK